ncbi:MAG: adenylosuccinate lyase [Anaplasmataceae bacterium]|nr:adenylosuccinate lyase [Anaplasmataceae bacterium]
MIPRYSNKELSSIWNDNYKFNIFLEIEILVCEANHNLGLIPLKDLENIKNTANFSIESINEIESEVKHDIIAFLTSVAGYVGESSKYIHMGMTSSDLLDTCLAVQLSRSIEIILVKITHLLSLLKDKAEKYKYIQCMGRTHGIYAEPITLGIKFARFYTEFKRNYERLKFAYDNIAVCSISGTVGTYISIDPYVEKYVAKKLGFIVEPVSSQIIPRDRHAMFFSVVGIIASSIENIATEIRHLQRSEVGECLEPFSKGQKGSSAMPHKRNPIMSENLTGLARILRSYATPAMENITLWHERDISHSSVERFICPDACITLDFALSRLIYIVEGLEINQKNIDINIKHSKGLYLSHSVLLHLISCLNITREEAYSIVQDCAKSVWNEDFISFEDAILSDSRLSDHQYSIKNLFKNNQYLKNIDYIFEKVFI